MRVASIVILDTMGIASIVDCTESSRSVELKHIPGVIPLHS